MAPIKTKEDAIARGMVPFGLAGNEARDEAVRAKTKGATSEKASISAKLRRVKDGTCKEPNKVIMELISNPEASASQIQSLIQEASKRDLKDSDFISLINTAIRKHSALFGTSVSVDADVRMNTTDRVMDRLKAWKENGGDKPVEYKVPEVLETPIGDVPIEDTTEVSEEEELGYEVVESEEAA